jgi:hypothetical protein
MIKKVDVNKFTLFPGGRFIRHGDGSAEAFFNKHVKPALDILDKDDEIHIDGSGTWGYGPSFTSQLGIYLKKYFGSKEEVSRRVTFTAPANPEAVDRVWRQLDKDDLDA